MIHVIFILLPLCDSIRLPAGEGAPQIVEAPYRSVPAREQDAMRALAFHARELIALAQEQVALAKAIHDVLERIYVSAMDFSVLEPVRARALEFLMM